MSRGRERFLGLWRDRVPLWLQTRCGVAPGSLAAVAVVLLLAVGLAVHHFWSTRPQPVPVPSAVAHRQPPSGDLPGSRTPGPPQTGGSTESATALVVDVTGEVREPGLHRIPAGSRVGDALEAAGGPLPDAETAGLNRARLVADGEQIRVGAEATGPTAPAAAGSAAVGGAAPPAPAGRVALNSATAEEFQSLPGIGPVLAQQIIDHRTRHGGFTSVEQLREVRGIGERRFADLEQRVGP